MYLSRLAIFFVVGPLLVGCGAVESYFGPAPTTARTCIPAGFSHDYRKSSDLPDCPRSTSLPLPTDVEAEQQWEEGVRDQAEQEKRYREEELTRAGSCIDVTSYDNNWDNDVLCIREDGTQFYTSYEGAEGFLSD